MISDNHLTRKLVTNAPRAYFYPISAAMIGTKWHHSPRLSEESYFPKSQLRIKLFNCINIPKFLQPRFPDVNVEKEEKGRRFSIESRLKTLP